ncbi:MAG TPA: hypothetical protein ENI87_01580 [bacterium]|nr:hypothetical protein [bacterium]
MVSARLLEVLTRGDGAGAFAGDDAVDGCAEHPVCGDRVQLSVRRDGDRVLAVRWRASGCPAVTAVAALCAKVLCDVPRAEVAPVLQAAIAAHGGLARHERHAESVVLRALDDALVGAGGG